MMYNTYVFTSRVQLVSPAPRIKPTIMPLLLTKGRKIPVPNTAKLGPPSMPSIRTII